MNKTTKTVAMMSRPVLMSQLYQPTNIPTHGRVTAPVKNKNARIVLTLSNISFLLDVE
jgi:hypothetical protein